MAANSKTDSLATIQLVLGSVLLAMATGFYFLDRTAVATHFIGPRFFAVLLAPAGVGFVASGLARRGRWPGWRWLQALPWIALALTIAWFRSLRQ